MANLQLAVKGEYFDAMIRGEKTEEYRLCNDYWNKRIMFRDYDRLIITKGYPKRDDSSRRIDVPYDGYEIKTITHPHFGDKPVTVFAVKVILMAKSAAERKAAQRARQAASGVRKLEIVLDAQEIEMLERNCATRRPGRAPYEFGEYIALLIRQDDARVRGRIKSISRKRCGKCGERVPVNSCPCNGDSQCWVTKGWHETKLIV